METLLINFFENLPTIVLVMIAAASLFTLGKGADFLVDEAVSLSVHWGIPKMVIGATIVSLGTTLPEATVSVLAAIQGNPDLALGNAIGSIIVDTGLIIGLAALIGTLPVDRNTINRQGLIQIGAAFLLAILALPFFSKGNEGVIYQWMGFVLLALLVLYIYISIKWAKNSSDTSIDLHEEKTPIFFQLIKLFFGVAVVIISSKILIPSVEITAIRIGIPQSVIAATIVAFGTSLPELMTAISSVRKGHGELAIGNIIGADILNVLFVVGAAAAVTTKGLTVPVNFFYLQIPTMLIILLVFRFFAKSKDNAINKKEGLILLTLYLIYLVLNFTWMV
ncbi:MAG: sodium:calcium antiporter [Firmicutes bacterium HGW-Firmicutes-1]|jgi:cation:H+ antiporter|nr:MAG: sodium:calcium antiporter [Firmicutes bacterium HGW-Firmicutes-1]